MESWMTNFYSENLYIPCEPYLRIIEQPASKAVRFRYESEHCSSGIIPGVNSTPENKTYPTVQIMGYRGPAEVRVSCVTKSQPYREHPHRLVGKECSNGVCTLNVNPANMIATFSSLNIYCVKKQNIGQSLKIREGNGIDPFGHGFAHQCNPNTIELNTIRLCFEGRLKLPGSGTIVSLTPVVSEPIYDKKAICDLEITRLSHTSAPVSGGQETMLFCEKVTSKNVRIRFFEEINGQILWEEYAEFDPTHVHHQYGIWFKTPRYWNVEVDRDVPVFIQLKRTCNNETSKPLPFRFTPCKPEYADSSPSRTSPPSQLPALSPINQFSSWFTNVQPVHSMDTDNIQYPDPNQQLNETRLSIEVLDEFLSFTNTLPVYEPISQPRRFPSVESAILSDSSPCSTEINSRINEKWCIQTTISSETAIRNNADIDVLSEYLSQSLRIRGQWNEGGS